MTFIEKKEEAKDAKSAFLSVLINSGLNTIISILISFLFNLFFVRVFGLEILGEYTLILSYVTIFFSIISIGVLSSFVREATWYASKDQKINGFITLVMLFIVAIILVIGVPSFYFLDNFKFIKNISSTQLRFIVIVLIIHLLLYTPSALLLNVFESHQKMKTPLIINTVVSLIKLVSLVFFYFTIKNLLSAIILNYLIPNLILFLLFLFFAFKMFKVKLTLSIKKDDFLHFKNLFFYSIKLFPVAFSELIIANLSFIYLSLNGKMEEVGSFRILFGVFLLINTFTVFIGKILLPMLTRFYYNEQHELARYYFMFFIKVATLSLTPILLSLSVFSSEILSLYKIKSANANLCFLLLLVGNYFMAGSFIGTLLSAYNKPLAISISLLVGALINFICLKLTIANYGIIGAAISVLCCYLFMQSFLFLYAKYKMDTHIPVNVILGNLLVAIGLYFLVKLLCFYFAFWGCNCVYLVLSLILYIKFVVKLNFFDNYDIERIKGVINGISNLKIRKILNSILGKMTTTLN